MLRPSLTGPSPIEILDEPLTVPRVWGRHGCTRARDERSSYGVDFLTW